MRTDDGSPDHKTRTSGDFPPDHLLDENGVAAWLGLQVSTLRRWRWSGRGPLFILIGSRVRYASADVREFIARGRRKSTSDPGNGGKSRAPDNIAAQDK